MGQAIRPIPKSSKESRTNHGEMCFFNFLQIAIVLSSNDTVTLLGNILDNAISAGAQTEEKQIWVRLWQEQGVCQRVVRNSCPKSPTEPPAQERMLHRFGTGLVSAILDELSG